eukprot:m.97452 g.97452  ORF g.97452 m.97452 type:complete len:458 (-) comp14829_c0_seq3:662-2035(-)
MATKQEKFALFKAQTQQYLDQGEAEEVKGILAQFLKHKELTSMITNLLQVLDTPDKRKMLPTIQSLIPPKFHDDFDALVKEKSPTAQRRSLQLQGLSDEEMAMRILDDPSLALEDMGESEVDGYEQGEDEAEEDECPVDIGQDEGEVSMFDLMIAMAEADLRLDTEEIDDMEASVPERRLSANDLRRKQMKQSMRMKQGGFKSASFVVRPTQPNYDDEDRALPDEVLQTPLGRKVDLPDYFCQAATRGEASKFLTMAGSKPGLFLVREKDMRPGGSFRRKPGQKLPSKAWAVSFVDKEGEIKNLLIEQESRGGPLKIGTQDMLDCTNVHQVLLKMKQSNSYDLKQTPFQCHRWYHGAISREEAESRLLTAPLDGRFLVRQSSREEDMYIISLIFDGRCFHNKVRYVDGAWIASAAPLIKHISLVDLVEHHSKAANGMQTPLLSICKRPTPCTLGDDE